MTRDRMGTRTWPAFLATVATVATAAAAVAMLAALAAPPAALAQAASEPATRPGITNIEEAARQRFTKRQFEQLTAKMIELAELLDKAEPQTAKVLREAVAQAQRAFIAEDMEKVAQLLGNGLAAAAANTQTEVISELRKVLQTLRLGILDLDERLERIRQMKEFREAIARMLAKQIPLERQSNLADKAVELGKQADDLGKQLAGIVAEQKDLKDKTSKLPPPDESVRKLMDIAAQIKDAIARQTALRNASASTPVDKLPINGQLQKILGEKTARLGKQISAAAADPNMTAKLGGKDAKDANSLSSAAESAGKAVDAMKEAADALGKSDASKAADPQDQALHDLKQAEKAVQDALAKLAGKDGPGAELVQKQSGLADKTGKLADAADKLAKAAGTDSDSSSQPGGQSGKPGESGNLDKAKEHMEGAAENLGQKDRDKALDKQQKALDELEGKKLKVADLKRFIDDKAKEPTAAQAAKQSDLAGQGDKTSKQMSAKADMPGSKSMGEASKSMGQASGKLGKGQSGQANEDQKKAIADMKKASDELNEAIEQEEQLAQAEQLEKIDRMLQKVLERQQAVSASTRETNDKRAADSTFARGEQIKLSELSRSEGKLAEDVETVRAILNQEGQSVVFTEVLGDVRGDMQDVQKLLDAQDPGPMAQAVEKEIERSLQDMIDAVRKELAERRKKAGGGGRGSGSGGGGKQPLVPVIAELKMIRTMEIAINRRTADLNKQVVDSKLPADQAKTEHGKLSRRQENVRKMAEELHGKINSGPGGGNRGDSDVGGF